MKRFIIEQADADIISHCGLARIGQAIKHHASIVYAPISTITKDKKRDPDMHQPRQVAPVMSNIARG